MPLFEPANETDEQRCLLQRHNNRDDDDDDDYDNAMQLDATLGNGDE